MPILLSLSYDRFATVTPRTCSNLSIDYIGHGGIYQGVARVKQDVFDDRTNVFFVTNNAQPLIAGLVIYGNPRLCNSSNDSLITSAITEQSDRLRPSTANMAKAHHLNRRVEPFTHSA